MVIGTCGFQQTAAALPLGEVGPLTHRQAAFFVHLPLRARLAEYSRKLLPRLQGWSIIVMYSPRGRGGTGRRAGLRIPWGNPCRFDSCRPHFSVSNFSIESPQQALLERSWGGFGPSRAPLTNPPEPRTQTPSPQSFTFMRRRSFGPNEAIGAASAGTGTRCWGFALTLGIFRAPLQPSPCRLRMDSGKEASAVS